MLKNQNSNPELLQNRQSKIQNQDVRILLWDIDGTLMRSTVKGGYLGYFAATMEKVFGSAGTLNQIMPSGMTDTQIMFEALRGEGFTPEDIFAEKENILKTFKVEMTNVLKKNGEPYEMLGGAKEILTETHKNPQLFNVLLTGNLSVAAEIKLKAVGLWRFFENAPNAFGEISHNRNDLAVEAGKLFNAKYNFQFNPKQFIVIGDTPNDIICARHFGAKVIAVATGRNQSAGKIIVLPPRRFFENLDDTAQVLHLLETL